MLTMHGRVHVHLSKLQQFAARLCYNYTFCRLEQDRRWLTQKIHASPTHTHTSCKHFHLTRNDAEICWSVVAFYQVLRTAEECFAIHVAYQYNHLQHKYANVLIEHN